MASGYLPTHPYDQRLAEPPRLSVPPPPVQYVNNRPSMVIHGVPSYDYQDEFGDPQFLQQLTSQEFKLNHRMLEWVYEERREAQAILPFLFLGPSSTAQDKDFLRRSGVTLLVAVRANESLHARLITSLTTGNELGLETEVIIASSTQELISKLPAAIQTINNHLQRLSSSQPSTVDLPGDTQLRGGKVLVFCENGNDRSPAIVLGYLMAMFNLSVIEAIHAVQSQRFCISADESLKQMLLDFQDLLRAKRDVKADERSTGNGEHHVWASSEAYRYKDKKKSLKRSSDEVYQSDEEMTDFNDAGIDSQSNARTGYPPFTDRDQ